MPRIPIRTCDLQSNFLWKDLNPAHRGDLSSDCDRRQQIYPHRAALKGLCTHFQLSVDDVSHLAFPPGNVRDTDNL
jgi:hypothetical protein